MKPRVYSMKETPRPKDAVYIGRPSPWGNPFTIGKDGTREEVISKYREWLSKQPDLITKMKSQLKGKSLVCFCSPLACHGDVILEVVNGSGTINNEKVEKKVFNEPIANEPIAKTIESFADYYNTEPAAKLSAKSFDRVNYDKPMKIILDGSCLGNPGPGGWAIVILDVLTSGELRKCTITGNENETTNNRMEITGLYRTLSYLLEKQDVSYYSRIEIVSDSKYAVSGINEWLPSWIRKGFKMNADIWKPLAKTWIALKKKNPNITIYWNERNGNSHMKEADKLAKEQAYEAKGSDFLFDY